MTDIWHMEKSAFFSSRIEEFVWPSVLKEIPFRCFASSDIRKIFNTDRVSRVCAEAFECSKIETFCSSVNTINIEEMAFADAYNLSDVNLSSSMVCFIKNDAFCRVDKLKLHLPYYYEEISC